MGKKLIIKGANFAQNAIVAEPRELTPVLAYGGAIIGQYANSVSEIQILTNQYTERFNVYRVNFDGFRYVDITTRSQKSTEVGYTIGCVAIYNAENVCIGCLPMNYNDSTYQEFTVTISNYPGASYILVDAGQNSNIPTAIGRDL